MRSSVPRLRGFLAAVTCGLVSGMSSVQAYDTEIFFQDGNQTGPNPNILLILDSSGSMGELVDSDSRMTHMQRAMRQIVTDLDNVNIGFMDFADPGAGLRYPVADLSKTAGDIEGTSDTTPVPDRLKALFDEMNPQAATPVVGAYMEGARYFLGKSVFWGTTRGRFKPSGNGGQWDYTNVPSTDFWGGIASGAYGGWLLSDSPTSSDPWQYDFATLPDGKSVFFQFLFDGARATKRVAHPASYRYIGSAPSPSVVRQTGCTDANLSASACQNEYIVVNAPTLVRNSSNQIRVQTGDPLYISPMSDSVECERNYIVLLSDGIANANYQQTETLIEDMAGVSCVAGGVEWPGAGNYGPDDFAGGSTPSSFSLRGQTCGRELASFLYETDHSPSLEGDQVVITHTVGFDLDDDSAIDFLQDIASNGGGSYFNVANSDDLVEALKNIVRESRESNTTFTAPTTSADPRNRLAHRDELFFSLFKPGANPAWAGNIKKYKLFEINNEVVVVGANNTPAVDTASGFFLDGSTDLFNSTGTPDGSDVALGGIASKLGTTRALYTYVGAAPPTSPVSLQSSIHRLDESNGNVTLDLLGIPAKTAAYRKELLDWARGADDNGDPSRYYGHPIHGGPVVITYKDQGATRDLSMFAVNNRGFFSIIDPDTGIEEFAWIPQTLLPNLDALKENLSAEPIFGLDSGITVQVVDGNDDGDLYDTGDQVNAFFGMRRGGRNYYALDVQNRNDPKLKWVVQGGTGGFAELGQSWSEPTLAKIKFGGSERMMLLIAGGYDVDQDNATSRAVDDQGRGIFMVDAETGALLWRAGPDAAADLKIPEMQYSIPAKVSVLDHNSDGLVDRLYVGDMGGNVFRIDFRPSNTGASDLAEGGVMATLSGATAQENRRFYNSPDIALISEGTGSYISVALGSGFRAHPLDVTTQDYFFALRDTHITDVVATSAYGNADPTTGRTLYHWDISSLSDLSANVIGQGTTPQAKQQALDALKNTDGWYLPMEPGEKVLSSSLTFAGNILWTTYVPPNNSGPQVTDVCVENVDTGSAFIYLVNAYSAVPKLDLDQSGNVVDLTDTDRRQQLAQATIPPSPRVVLFDKGDGTPPKPIVIVGAEPLGTPEGDLFYRTFWREENP